MAAKIKDGLFIGDADTSRDYEFLELNKIGNLVNLAGRQLGNTWASSGLVYLTFDWEDNPSCELFPEGGELDAIEDLAEFIDLSLRHGVSVLLFSARGVGRCVAAAVVYLMHKYRWGFGKAVQYVYAKKPDAALNDGFAKQLQAIDRLLQSARIGPMSGRSEHQSRIDAMRLTEWDPSYLLTTRVNVPSKLSDYDNDELILLNGYLNGRVTISSLPGPYAVQPKKNFAIRFGAELIEETAFPSSPLGGSARPARGCLKGSRQRHLLDREHDRERERDRDRDRDRDRERGQKELRSRVKSVASPETQAVSEGKYGEERGSALFAYVGLQGGGTEGARGRRGDESKGGGNAWEEKGERGGEDTTVGQRVERRSRSGMASLGSSVRAQHDIDLSELERELLPIAMATGPTPGTRTQGRGAWEDRSGGRNPSPQRSGSVGSGSVDEDRVPRTYRRGSPAPRGKAAGKAARPAVPDINGIIEKRRALALSMSLGRDRSARSLGSVDSLDSQGSGGGRSRGGSPSRGGARGGRPSTPTRGWRF